MSKLILSIAAILLSCGITFSQEDGTDAATKTYGGEGTITFANSGFGEYWSGGGLGSTTIAGILNTYSNKAYANGAAWDNSLRLDYGVAKVENTNGENFTKSSDVFDFISKYGTPVKNSDKWFYSAAFNVLTQLTDTRTAFVEETGDYQQLIGVDEQGIYGTNQSGFLAPGDISLGLGFDYKPNDNFSAFVGPTSVKLRVIADDAIANSLLFGNELGESTRFEAGASALANYNTSLLTDDMLSFQTGLKLFSNYLEDPQNVDVNWNTVTSLNPWKFMTITYTTDLAYDDNKQFTTLANGEAIGGVTEGIQFRNVLGIGLIHKFGDSKE